MVVSFVRRVARRDTVPLRLSRSQSEQERLRVSVIEAERRIVTLDSHTQICIFSTAALHAPRLKRHTAKEPSDAFLPRWSSRQMLDAQPSLFVCIYLRYWCVLNENDCRFVCITPAVKVLWRCVVKQSAITALPRAACDAARHQSDERSFRLHSQKIALRKVATASACEIFTGWPRPATGALAGVV